MASRDEYYALLSRALAGLDRDAYAARGAVYDREHKAMLRRLFAPDSYLSDAEIDEEQWAFREAIRRIEFGDEPDSIPLVPRRAVGQEAMMEAVPPVMPDFAPEREARVQPDPQPQQNGRRDIDWSARREVPPDDPVPGLSASPDAPPEYVEAPPPRTVYPRRRSVIGRAIGRVLLALILIAAGIAGYAVMTGQLSSPWLTAMIGTELSPKSLVTSDRAVLFDGELSEDPEEQNIGRAVWRASLEPIGREGASASVLHVDASVPQRRLVMSMSMRPEIGGAMSHLFELRFLRPDRQPDDSIANISGLLTRTTDGRSMLAGSVIKVSPGVFLFGLAGGQGTRERSLRQLKEMRWFDIPLNYSNGAKGILAIEKTGKAEQVVNDVISKWEG
jgi:hypothetical protein